MQSSTSLRVGGLAPLSTVDWPGELTATVFLRGCPWRCPYCHNAHLLSASAGATDQDLHWDDVLAFLRARVGLLDGVVFSGGEPLAQSGLAGGMREVRELGFRVGLHTGGVAPERLAEVLPLVDWIGFDVKAPFSEYERVTRVAGSGHAAEKSLRAVLASGVEHEVRTTVHPELLGEADLFELAGELRALGVGHWVLQAFRAEGALPGLLAIDSGWIAGVADRVRREFGGVELRG